MNELDEQSDHSVELSTQIFWCERGSWTEGLWLWEVKRTRVGVFLGSILDLAWGLVFWLFWLVLILGKDLLSLKTEM